MKRKRVNRKKVVKILTVLAVVFIASFLLTIYVSFIGPGTSVSLSPGSEIGDNLGKLIISLFAWTLTILFTMVSVIIYYVVNS